MYTRALIRIIPSIIIIIVTGHMLPWWSFSIIVSLVGYSCYYKKESLTYGFIIGFLSWFILLMYSFYNAGNDKIFSKMSLLIINIDNPILLIIISSLLSGIIGLISGWTGWQFNKREIND